MQEDPCQHGCAHRIERREPDDHGQPPFPAGQRPLLSSGHFARTAALLYRFGHGVLYLVDDFADRAPHIHALNALHGLVHLLAHHSANFAGLHRPHGTAYLVANLLK